MARLRGMSAGRASLRRLARRSDVRTPVLLYHRIGDPELDPLQLGVTRSLFEQHLGVIAAHAEVVPLAEAAARPGTVALTFDDGYADNVTEAEPLLAKHGFPATIFIAPGYDPWWAGLSRALLGPGPLPAEIDIDVAGQRFRRETAPSAEARRRLHAELFALLLPLPDDEQRDTVDRLVRSTGAGEGEPRVMTREEVSAAAERGVFAFGAHTMTHPVLTELARAQLDDELARSKRWVEEATGRSAPDFAYPYGIHSRTCVRAVRRAGFDRAYVLGARSARPHDDPFRIPRFVVPGWDAGVFEEHLLSWVGPAA